MGLQPRGGGVFLSKQDGSPMVVAASELAGDSSQGPALKVIDIVSGETLGSSPIAAGYLIADPVHPTAYIDFYTRETGILQLDLPSLKVRARAPSDQRNDRMTLDPARGNLLVASPLRGRVMVYAADGLAPKAPIASTFGVRSLVVDRSRDLLLTASLVSNQVDVIDLKSGRRLKRLRVGPWLRNLAVDEACGRAFVSSRHGVYWVKYAEPHPTCVTAAM
jgi:hypothetical protein